MRRADHLPRVVIRNAARLICVIVKPCKEDHVSLSSKVPNKNKNNNKSTFYRAFCIKQ